MSDTQTSMTTSGSQESLTQSRARPLLGRRALLTGFGALGAAWNAGTSASHARPDPATIAADLDPSSLLVKLVRRATFGYSTAEMALAASLGYHGYLEQHLHPAGISDAECDLRLATLPTASMTYNELVEQATIPQIRNETTDAVLLRAIFSRRQLLERVVEFWNDHFSINLNNEENFYLTPVHDRTVIRPNALTTFSTILSAVAHSPAMLYFLNNDVSSHEQPNENYARELLELHTMGPDSGFTQHDVVDISRCFTGWTWWRNGAGDLNGSFRFDPAAHDNDEKLVLGQHIPAGGGEQDGVTVLRILAEHPSTARFIAGKLCRKFVSEECPTGVIEHVAGVYTQSGGDIRALLRAVLSPNILADAAPKYKRPLHHLASALRALPCNIVSTLGLRDQLTAAGHRPFFWVTPDGYPDTYAHWQGFILSRWNFGAAMLENYVAGVSIDHYTLFNGLFTADEMADRLNQCLFGGEMPAPHRDRIRDYLLPDRPNITRQREAIGLAIGSPAFQWH